MEGAQVVELLRKLALLGLAAQSDGEAPSLSEAVTSKDAALCSKLPTDSQSAEQLWGLVHNYEISMIGLKRAFIELLESPKPSASAASLYIALLSSSHCPVLALFDRRLASGFLKQTRSLAHEESMAEKDSCKDLLIGLVQNFATFLRKFGLRDQPDVVREVADTFCEIAINRGISEMLCQRAFEVFVSLMHPLHGNVSETAATIMRGLTGGLLGLQKAGRKNSAENHQRSSQAVREQILVFLEVCSRSSAECKLALAALARHIMLKAPDKADSRSIASSSASRLVHCLNPADQYQFLTFVAKLSRSAKVSQRMSGVELAVSLYMSYEDPFREIAAGSVAAEHQATPNAQTMQAGQGAVPQAATVGATVRREAAISNNAASVGMTCIAILVQRASDKSPALRTKALSGLVTIATCEQDRRLSSYRNASFREALASAYQIKLSGPFNGDTPTIMAPATVTPLNPEDPGATPMDIHTPRTGAASTGGVGASGAPFVQRKGGLYRQALQAAFVAARQAEQKDLDMDGIILLARRRSSDDKATVRRVGLQLLEILLLMGMHGFGGAPGQLPCNADLDTIRAATADPLVSVRKAAVQAISKLAKAMPTSDVIAQLWVASVLPLVGDVEASIQELVLDQVDSLLLSPIAMLSQQSRNINSQISQSSVTAMLTALGVPGSSFRICLGQAMGKLAVLKKLKGEKAVKGLQAVIREKGSEETNRALVNGCWVCLSEISTHCPKAIPWDFLKAQWSDKEHPCQQYVLECIANSAAVFPPDEAQALFDTLLEAILSFSLPPDSISGHLQVLAELKTPGGASKQWAKSVTSAAEDSLSRLNSRLQKSSFECRSIPTTETKPLIAAMFTTGKIALLELHKTSARLLTLLQAFAAEKTYAAGGNAIEIPSPVQAHAWLALGNICLVDESVAKANIQGFVENLRTASSPAVRNNIMVALADMCIQYTALVDSHIPQLAACLSDPNELVRRQGLALLANLLSKDFVKWRGALFHKFTLSLVDESKAICRLAQFLLQDTLATKVPLLAYNHFVESIFFLNDCTPPQHDSLAMSQQSMSQAWTRSQIGASSGFPGGSPEHRSKRDTVYRILLHQMNPEHKFATAAKLCQDILGGFADQTLDLFSSGEVLHDALTILASKEIKVTANKGGASADDEAENLTAAAKGKVVSAMMRKHLMEGIVPVMVELKRLLEARRHPLLHQLMITMRALLKDHKSEIEDILVADRQFAKELLYDIRQDEIAAKKSARTGPSHTPTQQSEGPMPIDVVQPCISGTGSKASSQTAAGPEPAETRQMQVSESSAVEMSDHSHRARGCAEDHSINSPVRRTEYTSHTGSEASRQPGTPLADEVLREHRLQHSPLDRRRSAGGASRQAQQSSGGGGGTPSRPAGVAGQIRRPSRLSNAQGIFGHEQTTVTPAHRPMPFSDTSNATPAARARNGVPSSPMTIPKIRHADSARKSSLKPAGPKSAVACELPQSRPGAQSEADLDVENADTEKVVSVPTPLKGSQRQWQIRDTILVESNVVPEKGVAGLSGDKAGSQKLSRLGTKRKALA